jgi:hypothetical protein
MQLDSAKEMLQALWLDQDYLDSKRVMYDVSDLNALPDVNEMIALGRYVVGHKLDRGPNTIAFVAPEFASPGMKKVFAGFAKIVGLTLHFCGDESQARSLLAKTGAQD